MLNVKQLIDDSMTKLDIGEAVEIPNLIRKDAESLRVRLSIEIKKMNKLHTSLASSFWVSRTMQEDKELFTVTLGKGLARGIEINIIKKDGSSIPYEEGIAMKVETSVDTKAERIRKLKEQDAGIYTGGHNLGGAAGVYEEVYDEGDPNDEEPTFEKSERRVQDEN
jgi:hypothetical protein